jgi:hypothetical protein
MTNNINLFKKSKSRIFSLAFFTTSYWVLLRKLHSSDNEILRMAAAGSLMTNIAEMSFYPLDTINSSSKVC